MAASKETARAFTEVYEILQRTDEEVVEKVPKELREIYEKERDRSYDFGAVLDNNPHKELSELISDETRGHIAMLYRDYWVPPEEREEFINTLEKNQKEHDREMYRKMAEEDDD